MQNKINKATLLVFESLSIADSNTVNPLFSAIKMNGYALHNVTTKINSLKIVDENG